MIPSRNCPTPDACELIGCDGRCKRQAVAKTPQPIPLAPLGLEALTGPERGIIRLHDTIHRLFGRRSRPPEAEPASAPFLPAPEPEAPPVSDSLITDGGTLAAPAARLTPTPPHPSAASATAPRPTTPAQIVPVARGGFVLVVDGALTAVARSPEDLAEICREWASGAYL